MVDLQIELDRLQQYLLVDHHVLDGIFAEAGDVLLELLGLEPRLGGLDNVFALLGRLFYLASEEETAGGHGVARELVERVEHVEAVKEDNACGHCVVAPWQNT